MSDKLVMRIPLPSNEHEQIFIIERYNRTKSRPLGPRDGFKVLANFIADREMKSELINQFNPVPQFDLGLNIRSFKDSRPDPGMLVVTLGPEKNDFMLGFWQTENEPGQMTHWIPAEEIRANCIPTP